MELELIEEVPGDTEMQHRGIHGVMRRKEVSTIERRVGGVLHQQEESCVLQVQVSIDIDKGEVANLGACGSILLHGKLIEG